MEKQSRRPLTKLRGLVKVMLIPISSHVAVHTLILKNVSGRNTPLQKAMTRHISFILVSVSATLKRTSIQVTVRHILNSKIGYYKVTKNGRKRGTLRMELWSKPNLTTHGATLMILMTWKT